MWQILLSIVTWFTNCIINSIEIEFTIDLKCVPLADPWLGWIWWMCTQVSLRSLLIQSCSDVRRGTSEVPWVENLQVGPHCRKAEPVPYVHIHTRHGRVQRAVDGHTCTCANFHMLSSIHTLRDLSSVAVVKSLMQIGPRTLPPWSTALTISFAVWFFVGGSFIDCHHHNLRPAQKHTHLYFDVCLHTCTFLSLWLSLTVCVCVCVSCLSVRACVCASVCVCVHIYNICVWVSTHLYASW